MWIDDEISRSDPAVVFLQHEGFTVDCAATGAAGLALARTTRHDCILLDLRLPDIAGLAVLEDLRSGQVTTPVVVVTGFGDFETARKAGQLGVAAFEVKPVFVDDLKVSVERAVRSAPLSSSGAHPARASDLGHGASSRALAMLFQVLHRLTQRSGDSEVSQKIGTTAHATIASALSRALADRTISMLHFLACGRALRFTMTSNPIDIAERVQTLMLEISGRTVPKDSRVIGALEMLESAANRPKRMTLREISNSQRVHNAHLSRLIADETGFGFTEWRTGFLLRPSLGVLAETDEHVKQIACHLLGFGHQAHFDAEFHRFFGVTPSTFRRLSRNI